ncbi:ABC transporter ATP-binding protein [Piscinibacter terrae]|uniref:ABC transporter ATP-binding protein n=1 Tax=Piscinibacter terrae TaxID=2496871 RepID=A0A3N7JUR5_9BURK|nr:ABC transporter ATP-binding protein [Albitalea terrae]RQP22655.1 ABC transporter ATP-binding protein [Albitalea terrae]
MKIRTDAVCKEYQLGRSTVHAVRNASITINAGEFVAIKGPSGSGKSTLLHMIGALDQPTSGEIWLGDSKLNDLDDSRLATIRRNEIGFIFQSFNLIPVLSVFGNVELPLRLQRVPAQERKQRVEEMLHAVGLTQRALHKTEELSGGQRQRVAIARALVTRPQVILSDEPTANLDSKTGDEILDLMRRLNQDHQVTLIFATHDHSIVERADRVVSILDGEIIDDRRMGAEPKLMSVG